MIPFSIAGCILHSRDGDSKEVRILELSEEGFTFRLAEEWPLIQGIEKLVLYFYDFEKGDYRELILRDFRIEREDVDDVDGDHEVETITEQFCLRYRMTTDDKDYQHAAEHLTGEYIRYVHLKLEGDDAHLSEALTGYPAEAERYYPESFLSQKRQWFAGWNQDEFGNVSANGWEASDLQGCELALSLDRPGYYQSYLQMPLQQFVAYFWEKNQLLGHPLTRKKADCLYIGNQFCHLLFPEKAQLFQMLEKARTENVKTVLAFTYMQECRMDEVRGILEDIARWCRNYGEAMEIVVNDWGMLSMLREEIFSCLKPSLGILLQKRRKDVRMKYKRDLKEADQRLRESAIQADFYREYLRNHFRVQRFSYESCGYPINIAPGGASLHFPFYQMNTSQFCTLYAKCRNGKRGRQCAVTECEEYCRDSVFLYPEFLHMAGRYNSLFGYDDGILGDGRRIRELVCQGVDRIVAEFL